MKEIEHVPNCVNIILCNTHLIDKQSVENDCCITSHIEGLTEECGNSTVKAPELPQSVQSH